METFPQPRADNQPQPQNQRSNGSFEGSFAAHNQPEKQPPSNGWERIFAKHEQLRQLIDQAPQGIAETDEKGRTRRPNMTLENYSRGPVSQAYGWIEAALADDPKLEFDWRESPENYRGDPVEQSLLWLLLNFEPDEAEPEIIDIVDLLSDGQIEQAHDKLKKYIFE